MHLEILVEEPSAQAALGNLLPRILGPGVSFCIHELGGKQSLLKKLPARLRGYRSRARDNYRVVVLVDEDRQDCRMLKAELERSAASAGLRTKSAASPSPSWHVLNRIAAEELEAWFFGDPAALRLAFPRLPKSLERSAALRDPDAIAGGTWEHLERLLKRSGYYAAGMPKIEVANLVSGHMNVERNSSRSFRTFRDGLRSLVL